MAAVHFGQLLMLISTAWKALQVAKDAQTPWHQDVDQPTENRLTTLS